MIHWLTPWHLNFFFGVFLTLQTGLFVYFETTYGVTDRQDRIRGRDFLQFYLAGRLVAEGRSELLYDQGCFLTLQKSIGPVDEKNPPYLSVYPPHLSLLFSLFGKLSYPRAIEAWWLVQLICVIISGWLLVKQVSPSREWHFTAWLGVLAFYPVLNTFWNGQLSAILLLAFTVGFSLHRQQRYVLAGLVFSLISIKPQLALGIYLWLVIRGDWRTLMGVALGGLVQLGLVAGILGPDVLVQYVQTAKFASSWYARYTMSPDHQHALAGILTTWFGNDFSRYALLAQGIIALISGCFLWKLRRTPYEYAAAILFTLNCAPHLLTYDLSYLLVAVASMLVLYQHDQRLLLPIIILYGAAMISPLYVATQASLVPAAMLVVVGWLFVLHTTKRKQGSSEEEPCPM